MQNRNYEKGRGVTVDQWVEMFQSIGLNEDQMRRWHQEFESRHPDGHQSFLEWLALPEERIAQIRATSGDA